MSGETYLSCKIDHVDFSFELISKKVLFKKIVLATSIVLILYNRYKLCNPHPHYQVLLLPNKENQVIINSKGKITQARIINF